MGSGAPAELVPLHRPQRRLQTRPQRREFPVAHARQAFAPIVALSFAAHVDI